MLEGYPSPGTHLDEGRAIPEVLHDPLSAIGHQIIHDHQGLRHRDAGSQILGQIVLKNA